jgi:hypothetical protein
MLSARNIVEEDVDDCDEAFRLFRADEDKHGRIFTALMIKRSPA